MYVKTLRMSSPKLLLASPFLQQLNVTTALLKIHRHIKPLLWKLRPHHIKLVTSANPITQQMKVDCRAQQKKRLTNLTCKVLLNIPKVMDRYYVCVYKESMYHNYSVLFMMRLFHRACCLVIDVLIRATIINNRIIDDST